MLKCSEDFFSIFLATASAQSSPPPSYLPCTLILLIPLLLMLVSPLTGLLFFLVYYLPVLFPLQSYRGCSAASYSSSPLVFSPPYIGIIYVLSTLFYFICLLAILLSNILHSSSSLPFAFVGVTADRRLYYYIIIIPLLSSYYLPVVFC